MEGKNGGKRRKVGILGGTFDPIHNAHLQLGREAKRTFQLDAIWVMPTGNSYFKTRRGRQVTDAADRAAMVRLAVAGEPGFCCSEREVRRQGETYTADTLRELAKAYPDTEFYFIVGADTIHSMDTWHQPETIFQNAVILAANRNHQVPEEELRRDMDRLRLRYGARIRQLDFQSDVSSSQIRRRLEAGERKGLPLPPPVLEYIREKQLYEGGRHDRTGNL